MNARAGRGPAGRAGERIDELLSRSLGRGVSTGPASEAIATGPATMQLAALERVSRPFKAISVALNANDPAAGSVMVSLYRIGDEELDSDIWLARRSFILTAALPVAFGTVILPLDDEKVIDPRSTWLVGVRTANALATLRGTDAGTKPGMHGWARAAAEPQTIASTAVTRSRLVPSVTLLSVAGVRLLTP